MKDNSERIKAIIGTMELHARDAEKLKNDLELVDEWWNILDQETVQPTIRVQVLCGCKTCEHDKRSIITQVDKEILKLVRSQVHSSLTLSRDAIRDLSREMNELLKEEKK